MLGQLDRAGTVLAEVEVQQFACHPVGGSCGRRGIGTVIPEQSTHSAHRQRRGRRSGQPVGLNTQKYKGRNVIERSFNNIKNWRGLSWTLLGLLRELKPDPPLSSTP